ncbi:hypothetical protein [Sphingomonas sp.]|uniref:hypothetical protein n=1 Tax=Sphingomonas sp. TaxID=28214 RepID=UPI003AFFE3EA
MTVNETSGAPTSFKFDVAVAAIGYEQRCRYVVGQKNVTATRAIGLEFGFLREASFASNLDFFRARGWEIHNAQGAACFDVLVAAIVEAAAEERAVSVFVDISAMSREMMANIVLALSRARSQATIRLSVAYAPTQYGISFRSAPIRLAAPVKPELAGWSSRPDKPLGVIMGLGCEPGLSLGALQVLEPNKAWLYSPCGFDERFADALKASNEHIADIFDVTEFDYEISEPSLTRGRIEALLNALEGSFRIICIPFGPKIYAWLILATVVFQARRGVGVWSFSSRDQAEVVDRPVSGETIWYNVTVGAAQFQHAFDASA